MRKTKLPNNESLAAYKKPKLVSYGSLSDITKATSGGSIIDGGTMPNLNLRMN